MSIENASDNPTPSDSGSVHKIEQIVRVYLMFEDGRWRIDPASIGGVGLEGLDAAECVDTGEYFTCAVCSAPEGIERLMVADATLLPTSRQLLDMLAVAHGYELARPGETKAVDLAVKLSGQLSDSVSAANELIHILAVVVHALLDDSSPGLFRHMFRHMLGRVIERMARAASR
ncbi:hypothetical protein OG225_41820 (plasmid) [Nocardia sp. NBC_01377]|uniref:hypothetical protein n=1 Tax=Nocardia sp. NBC_01377 TaxID=2903595 RepID=UPI002F913F48